MDKSKKKIYKSMQLTTTLYHLTSVSSIMSSFQHEASYKDFKVMEEEFEKKIAEKKSTDNLTKYEIAEELLEKRVEQQKKLENNIKEEFENKKELYLEKIKENYGLIQGFELKNFNIDFEEYYDDENFKKGLILEMKKMLLEDHTSFEAFEKHFQSIIYCGKPLLDFSEKYSLDFIETLCEVLLRKGENYINKYDYYEAFLYYFIYNNIFKDEKEKRKDIEIYRVITNYVLNILSSTIKYNQIITKFICIRDIKKIIKLFSENQSEENRNLFLVISRCSYSNFKSNLLPRSPYNVLYLPIKILESDMWNFFNYYKKLFDWDFEKSKDEFLQTMNTYSERQIMGCSIDIRKNDDFFGAKILYFSVKYFRIIRYHILRYDKNEKKSYLKKKILYLSDKVESDEIYEEIFYLEVNIRFSVLELDNFFLLVFKLLFFGIQNEFFKKYYFHFKYSRIDTIDFLMSIKSNNEIENYKEMLMKYFYFIDIDIDLFNEYRRILLGINEKSIEKNIEKTKIRENLKYLVDIFIQKEDPNEIIECLAGNIEILILYCFLNCYKMNFYYKRMGGYKKLLKEISNSGYFNGKIFEEKYFVFVELFRWKIDKEMEYKLFKKIFFELKDIRIVLLAIYVKNEYFERYLRGGNINNSVSEPNYINIISFLINH